ncbi:aminoglycoside phosphotransferase family protein [Janibacter cremeus]|uniref:phosphotransferase family protein n=1 Tax=Janibacter cremeus TaxID=1285192 RepID=UPI0023F75155|nr:aminoglycoside phosphotransferase family protein [Janibacter cremeus]WEV78884.1 aminoglycoside phosphotransferase family protein [Janibacter cremeus]
MTPATAFPSVGTTAAEHGLTLVRAHPRPDRLHLDLTDEEGRRVIGQWIVEGAQQVAAATEAVAPGRVRLLGRHLVLQAKGADRRLPALAALVADGAELVVHRPERRAVVRTGAPHSPLGGGERAGGSSASPHPPEVVYTKVVRPRRTADLVRRMEQAAAVPGLDVPRVVAADEGAGTVRMSTLPGRTLHDLLAEGGTDAAERIGAAARTLHSAGEIDGVPGHDLTAELGATRGLIDLARTHHALGHRVLETLGRDVERAATAIAAAGPVARRSLLHRDLHDKQLLVDRDGVGMLDVDTLGLGDPALDLGNLLAHLDLRVEQGWASRQTADVVEDGVLSGYRPGARTRAAAAGYRALTRARLRALYAFRPGDLPAHPDIATA